jgi:hypothetical protein
VKNTTGRPRRRAQNVEIDFNYNTKNVWMIYSDSEQELVTGSREQANGRSGSIKGGEYLDQLRELFVCSMQSAVIETPFKGWKLEAPLNELNYIIYIHI